MKSGFIGDNLVGYSALRAVSHPLRYSPAPRLQSLIEMFSDAKKYLLIKWHDIFSLPQKCLFLAQHYFFLAVWKKNVPIKRKCQEKIVLSLDYIKKTFSWYQKSFLWEMTPRRQNSTRRSLWLLLCIRLAVVAYVGLVASIDKTHD